MQMNKLDERIVQFVEPIFTGEVKKGMPTFICFINIAFAAIILEQHMTQSSIMIAVVGAVLAFLSFIVIGGSDSKLAKAIYGFFETLFMLGISYYATYTEYINARLDVQPYFIYTQMVGLGIFVTFLLILLYRLKGPKREITDEQVARGIKVGLWIGIFIIVGIGVGLIVLYYTVFKREIHLVESSKMLYAAMVMNVLMAYYALKSYYAIKYQDIIKKQSIGKNKKKKKK